SDSVRSRILLPCYILLKCIIVFFVFGFSVGCLVVFIFSIWLLLFILCICRLLYTSLSLLVLLCLWIVLIVLIVNILLLVLLVLILLIVTIWFVIVHNFKF